MWLLIALLGCPEGGVELTQDAACGSSRGRAEDAAAFVEGINCDSYGPMTCGGLITNEEEGWGEVYWSANCPSGGTGLRVACFFEQFDQRWQFRDCVADRF